MSSWFVSGLVNHGLSCFAITLSLPVQSVGGIAWPFKLTVAKYVAVYRLGALDA